MCVCVPACVRACVSACMLVREGGKKGRKKGATFVVWEGGRDHEKSKKVFHIL